MQLCASLSTAGDPFFIHLGAVSTFSGKPALVPPYYFYGFETHPNPLGYKAFAEGAQRGRRGPNQRPGGAGSSGRLPIR